jgi:alkaline phosphatase
MARLRRTRLTVVLFALLAVLLVSPFASAAPQADSAVLFIGDGMGQAQVELANLVASLSEPLAIKQMPYSGTAITLEAKGEITDSAAAGTALATGRKTNDGMIGVSPDGKPMESILERCKKLGKSVGVITTDNLSGATPASFLAHVDDRGKGAEIAVQESQTGVPVLLGFWKGWFAPKAAGGGRTDDRDVTAEMQKAGYDLLYTRPQLLQSTQPKILGMFDDDDGKPAPSQADLVTAALERLSRNPKGFLLIVESARVDWIPGMPMGVLGEIHNMDEAVRTAVSFAHKRGKMVVVVTADHETGGLVIQDRAKVMMLRNVKATEEQMARQVKDDRSNLREVLAEYAGIADLSDAEIEQIKSGKYVADAIGKVLSQRAGLSWNEGDHTATPVGVFAFGPGAETIKGDMDNTDIPKRIAAAMELGAFPE